MKIKRNKTYQNINNKGETISSKKLYSSKLEATFMKEIYLKEIKTHSVIYY